MGVLNKKVQKMVDLRKKYPFGGFLQVFLPMFEVRLNCRFDERRFGKDEAQATKGNCTYLLKYFTERYIT